MFMNVLNYFTENVCKDVFCYTLIVVLLLSLTFGYAVSKLTFRKLFRNEETHSESKSQRKPNMAESLIPSKVKQVVREDQYSGPFSDPVYKKIAHRNGEINKMTRDDMRKRLSKLGLDTRGVKEVLKKRLKNYYKKQQLGRARVIPPDESEQKLDRLIVIDFEATCEEYNPAAFQYEIIEFPVVLIDVQKKTVIDVFHEYVRPVKNPKLSHFCVNLTGIKQETVDKASIFTEVLSRVQDWMAKHCLGSDYKFAVVTDGPWDMSRFMHMQCTISAIPFPDWGKKWINIRKSYSNFYGFQRVKLSVMLEKLGMEFEGQQHSGIDDTRNIARIVLRMLDDGFVIRVNERLYAGKEKIKLPVEPVTRREADHSDEESDDSFVVFEDDKANTSWENGAQHLLPEQALPSDHNYYASHEHARQGFQKLTLRSRSPSPEQHYEDLLTYYALQSNK